MKKYLIHFPAIVVGFVIWAATSVPAAAATTCQLTLSENSINLGRINMPQRMLQRSDDGGQKISSSNRTLSITCNASVPMLLEFRAAAANAGALSLGPSGSYTVRILRARMDGQPLQIGRASSSTQVPTEVADQLQLLASDSITAVSEQKVASGKRFDLELQIEAFIRKDAAVSDEIKLEGEGRFDLNTN